MRSVCIFNSGSVLPLLLVMLAGSSAIWLSHTDLNEQRTSLSSEASARLLAAAKKSLLTYALAYADNYQPSGAGIGHFPCPDHDPISDGILSNDGPDPPCAQTSRQLGRLPRQTFTYNSPYPTEPDGHRLGKRIEFYAQRSLVDQQPWYAVSSAFINNPHTVVVNSLSKGTLSVDGVENVVAIVIAPGKPFTETQLNRPGDDLGQYLEGENADGDFHFTQGQNRISNDRLTYITTAELSRSMEKRVALFVVRWFEQFRQQHCHENSYCYPYAAENIACAKGALVGTLPFLPGNCDNSLAEDGLLDNTPIEDHWFVRNEWHHLFRYELSPQCLRLDDHPCSIDVQYGHQREDGVSVVSIRPVPPDNGSDTRPLVRATQ